MRHVSRTHGVDLDWLFERITKDPGVSIQFVPTKEQLADVLTKGSFTAKLGILSASYAESFIDHP